MKSPLHAFLGACSLLVVIWLLGFLSPLAKKVFEAGWNTWEYHFPDPQVSP